MIQSAISYCRSSTAWWVTCASRGRCCAIYALNWPSSVEMYFSDSGLFKTKTTTTERWGISEVRWIYLYIYIFVIFELIILELLTIICLNLDCWKRHSKTNFSLPGTEVFSNSFQNSSSSMTFSGECKTSISKPCCRFSVRFLDFDWTTAT